MVGVGKLEGLHLVDELDMGFFFFSFFLFLSVTLVLELVVLVC